MTTNRAAVLAAHPQAWASWNPDAGMWKIYTNGPSYVALSASRPTEAAAWEDAARGVRERAMRQQEKVT